MDEMLGHNGGPPLEDDTEYDALMGMSVEEILREGQKALFARLVGKVRSGTASHQEAAILRNLLKDNGLTLGIPPEKPKDEGPAMELPEFGEPEFQ